MNIRVPLTKDKKLRRDSSIVLKNRDLSLVDGSVFSYTLKFLHVPVTSDRSSKYCDKRAAMSHAFIGNESSPDDFYI